MSEGVIGLLQAIDIEKHNADGTFAVAQQGEPFFPCETIAELGEHIGSRPLVRLGDGLAQQQRPVDHLTSISLQDRQQPDWRDDERQPQD